MACRYGVDVTMVRLEDVRRLGVPGTLSLARLIRLSVMVTPQA